MPKNRERCCKFCWHRANKARVETQTGCLFATENSNSPEEVVESDSCLRPFAKGKIRRKSESVTQKISQRWYQQLRMCKIESLYLASGRMMLGSIHYVRAADCWCCWPTLACIRTESECRRETGSWSRVAVAVALRPPGAGANSKHIAVSLFSHSRSRAPTPFGTRWLP